MTNRACFFLIALALGPVCRLSLAAEADDLGERFETLKLEAGNLSVLLRDNSNSPKILSGLDSLFNLKDAPSFDAFDPDDLGASVGLNFEHVICGHSNQANAFTPRRGRYELHRQGDGVSAMLVRKPEDDPWALASSLKYKLTSPNAVDFEFQCVTQRPELFGEQGYAVLFFADYMNHVADVAIHFRGVPGPGQPEEWIRADAPPGHPDYNHGGTYRSLVARDLQYDTNHNFKLNLWSYDYPRFTQPSYYGLVTNGMVFMLMFDRMHTEQDEIRFSLFKFKVRRYPRPAWDFQYVIHKVEKDQNYGFKGRLVWKKFVSAEDCQEEYRNWQSSLGSPTGENRQPR